ncbi:hypothetical protein D3C87_1531930 [compost metagenome]
MDTIASSISAASGRASSEQPRDSTSRFTRRTKCRITIGEREIVADATVAGKSSKHSDAFGLPCMMKTNAARLPVATEARHAAAIDDRLIDMEVGGAQKHGGADFAPTSGFSLKQTLIEAASRG